MDWITKDIAIGNYLESQNESLIQQHGFESVLSLDGTMTGLDATATHFSTVRAFSLIDGPGNDPALFFRVLDSLSVLVQRHPPVLVHCHAGRSRSVVVVAGFLMRTAGLDYFDALDHVRAKREVALTSGIEGLLTHL